MRIKGGDNINISPPSHGVMTVALTHSPSLIAPTAETPPTGDNTTRLATSAFVTAAVAAGGGGGGGGGSTGSGIYAYSVTSANGSQTNYAGLSCSLSGTTYTYTFPSAVSNANYGISVQHEDIPSTGLPANASGSTFQKDSNLNPYINVKTVNGFQLHFGFGDQGTDADVPHPVDHSVMVYGLGGGPADRSVSQGSVSGTNINLLMTDGSTVPVDITSLQGKADANHDHNSLYAPLNHIHQDVFDAFTGLSTTVTNLSTTVDGKQNALPSTTRPGELLLTTTTAGTYALTPKADVDVVRFGTSQGHSLDAGGGMNASSTLVGKDTGVGTSSNDVLTAYGFQAGKTTAATGEGTFIGFKAGEGSNTTVSIPNRNTFLGHSSGKSSSGYDNSVVGASAGESCTGSLNLGMGRGTFRGAAATGCIAFGMNAMGSFFGFDTTEWANHAEARTGVNKFLVGHNMVPSAWDNGGSPYIIDAQMGSDDTQRSFKLNANQIYFGSALPSSGSGLTATQIWSDSGVLRIGTGTDLNLYPGGALTGAGLSQDNTQIIFTKDGSSDVTVTLPTPGSSTTILSSYNATPPADGVYSASLLNTSFQTKKVHIEDYSTLPELNLKNTNPSLSNGGIHAKVSFTGPTYDAFAAEMRYICDSKSAPSFHNRIEFATTSGDVASIAPRFRIGPNANVPYYAECLGSMKVESIMFGAYQGASQVYQTTPYPGGALTNATLNNAGDAIIFTKDGASDVTISLSGGGGGSNITLGLSEAGVLSLSGDATSTTTLNSRKIAWDVYQALADLPPAVDNHGMIAHVHTLGSMFFAHNGNWTQLLDIVNAPVVIIKHTNQPGATDTDNFVYSCFQMNALLVENNNLMSVAMNNYIHSLGMLTNVTINGQVLTFTKDGHSPIQITIPGSGGLVAQTSYQASPAAGDVYAASYLNTSLKTRQVTCEYDSATTLPGINIFDTNYTRTDSPYYSGVLQFRARVGPQWGGHFNAIYCKVNDYLDTAWNTMEFFANGGPKLSIGRASNIHGAHVTVTGYFRATDGIRFAASPTDTTAGTLQTVAYPGGACTAVAPVGVRTNKFGFTFHGQATDTEIEINDLKNYTSGTIGTSPDYTTNSLSVAGTQNGSGIVYIGPNTNSVHEEELQFRTNKYGNGEIISKITNQARDFTNQTVFNYAYELTKVGAATTASAPYAFKQFRCAQGNSAQIPTVLRIGKDLATDWEVQVYGDLDVGDQTSTTAGYLRVRCATTTANSLAGQLSFTGGAAGGAQSEVQYACIETYVNNATAGSQQGYVMHKVLQNNAETPVMQVGAITAGTPEVRVFGECHATTFRSSNGHQNVSNTNVVNSQINADWAYALDTNSQTVLYTETGSFIGNSTVGSRYGYIQQAVYQNDVKTNMLRVGRPDASASYFEDIYANGTFGAHSVFASHEFIVRNLAALNNNIIGSLRFNAQGTNSSGTSVLDTNCAKIQATAARQTSGTGSYGMMSHHCLVNGNIESVLDVGYVAGGTSSAAGDNGVAVQVHGKLKATKIRFDDGTEMATASGSGSQTSHHTAFWSTLTPIPFSLKGATNRMSTIGTLTGSHTTGATSGSYQPIKMWDQVLGEQPLAGWGTAPIAFMFVAGSGPYAVNEFTIWCAPVGTGDYLDSLRTTVLKIYGSNDATIATDGTWHDLNQHVNIGGIAGASPDTNMSPWVVDAEACKSYTETSGAQLQGWVFRASSNIANYGKYKLQCVGGNGFDPNYELGGITLDYKKRYELDYM